MKLTINGLLSAKNHITGRKAELDRMRSASLSKEEKSYDGSVTKSTPVYDAKVLDKRITEIQNWLYKIDFAIKETNARTLVDLDVPVDELLSPVE